MCINYSYLFIAKGPRGIKQGFRKEEFLYAQKGNSRVINTMAISIAYTISTSCQ